MATTYTDRFSNNAPSGSVILTPFIGTSTSSQTVSTSSGISFSVQNNRAWRAGTRLRATNPDGSMVMEGETVSYSGSSELVMEVDYTEGTGSTDSWTLNVTGARGSSGATGATGQTGSSGADGNGVATGGMNNEILYKNSTADFMTAWRSLSDQLDAVIGSTQPGALIYRGSTIWTALAPATSSGLTLQSVSTAAPGWVSVAAPTAVQDVLHYQDQAAQGTAGSTGFVSQWITAPLDTEVVDTAGIGSLGSNLITLTGIGRYEIDAMVNTGGRSDAQGKGRLRLLDVTSSAVLFYGLNNTNGVASGSTHGSADLILFLKGSFAINSSRTIAVQAYRTNAQDIAPVSVATGTEVYSDVFLKRISTSTV